MGRLTLNVLLSFAQFEREVISERVRDKIAASKRKGMWMGGPVPLGYDVKDRKLIVNEAEAETVQYINASSIWRSASVPELVERPGVVWVSHSKVQKNWSNGRTSREGAHSIEVRSISSFCRTGFTAERLFIAVQPIPASISRSCPTSCGTQSRRRLVV